MSFAHSASSTQSLPSRSPRQPESTASGPGEAALAVASTDILRGQRAVDIIHNGFTYRLQATRLGKLILTK
jgi:hemin uptake protein HemP